MVLAVKQTGKTLRRAMPAKKPVPTDSYGDRISARLRELREAKGWTVADLAERINRRVHKDRRIANSTLHGWDSGSRNVDPDYYPDIAAVFQLTVRQFMPQE